VPQLLRNCRLSRLLHEHRQLAEDAVGNRILEQNRFTSV